MQPVSVDHYENFPVASILCPPAIRPAVIAIYGFARTADDLADEGDASPEQRLSDLADFRRDLDATAAQQAPSPRWAAVFSALSVQLKSRQLPLPLLHDLLSAFEQDVVKNRYADRAELLDYCRRSANPVGRLLLHLYGVNNATSLAQSDAICSALQLINFWQDLSVDTPRGRLYVPLSDCEKHAVNPSQMMQRQDNAATRALVADMVTWARSLMLQGAPLVHDVPGRAGWELRLVVQGGLRIAEKISRLQHASLLTRPTLRWFDVPVLLWRACRMRPPASSTEHKAA
jgi:hydroxysqualene synthase